MKIRNSFVSNSSSASFVISKSEITAKQAHALLNFVEYYKKEVRPSLGEEHYWYQSDEELEKWVIPFWNIEDKKDVIKGFTSIDNFEMGNFFKFIELAEDYIKD
jgi:hypothetical protein